MNDLGLPPHGHDPSFAADETAYGAVVRSATRRRRTRALAGTSTSAALALVAFTALSGPGSGTASLEPADGPSRGATAPASPGPSALAAPRLGNDAPPPFPTLPPLPGGSPSAKPSPTRAPGKPRPTPAPGGTAFQEWHESSSSVDDRPTERCTELDAQAGWCFRYLGPDGARSGESVTFEFELCRLSTATTPGTIDHAYDKEWSVWITGPGDRREEDKQRALSIWGYRDEPHTRSVDPGRCVRWAEEWNGLDFEGRALGPGTYDVLVFLQGETRYDHNPASDPDASRMWAYADREFVVS